MKKKVRPHRANSAVNHYATLDVVPGASAKEIREAYFRLRNTYSNNNQALYSLVCDSEIADALLRIEEAYTILCDAGKRQSYNASLSALTSPQLASSPQPGLDEAVCEVVNQGPNVSRLSPQYGTAREKKGEPRPTLERSGAARPSMTAVTASPTSGAEAGPAPYSQLHVPATARRVIAKNAKGEGIREKIAEIIADGDPSDGSLYRKIRQAVGIDKQEMQDHIKISVGYIDNLEENRFDLLPQPVYVKGFLKSYLKYLGVGDADRLVKSYSERFTTWFESKNS